MAAAKVVQPPIGFTRFGPSEPGKASGIILTDSAGNDWGLAVRQNGTVVVLDGDDLNDPTLNVELDGTVVGGQS